MNSEEWILELEEECKNSSQRKVAAKMGYSPTTINMVLKGYYQGDLKAVEKAFKGAFQNLTVNCPAVGEITTDICRKNQREKFSAHNPQRVAVYRACRSGCPHFKGDKK